MSTFLEILENNKKEYSFTIKLACSDVTDKMLDCMEDCLAQYDMISASKFKKSPLQKNPLDFPRVQNSEVHTSDIVTQYPFTSDMLEVQLSKSLEIPRTHIVVYSENDPRRAYDKENCPCPESEGGYEARVGTPIDASEEEDASGLGGQAQVDSAIEDALEKRKDRRVEKVYNELSHEEEFDDAKFEFADREGENVKSVFFGRVKD